MTRSSGTQIVARFGTLLAILLVVPKLARAAAPLADRVPGDALGYLGWTGADSLGPADDGSHLEAVLDASAFPQFFQTFLPQLIERVGPKNEQVAQVIQLISAVGGPMWRHPSALYFGGIDWSAGPQPMPRLALLCDAGTEADQLA